MVAGPPAKPRLSLSMVAKVPAWCRGAELKGCTHVLDSSVNDELAGHGVSVKCDRSQDERGYKGQ